MQHTQLGRTGRKVSRLVLGTMNFGPQTDEADSHAIVDAARDTGIHFLDTADMYGWIENKGRTEETIGNWFAEGGERATRSPSPPRCTAAIGLDSDQCPAGAGKAQYPSKPRTTGRGIHPPLVDPEPSPVGPVKVCRRRAVKNPVPGPPPAICRRPPDPAEAVPAAQKAGPRP